MDFPSAINQTKLICLSNQQIQQYAIGLCQNIIQNKPMLFLFIAGTCELIDILCHAFIKEDIKIIEKENYTLKLSEILAYLSYIRVVSFYTAFIMIWLGTKILQS